MLPRQQQLGTECTEAMRQEICHRFKKNLAAGRSRVRRQTIAVCVEELACFIRQSVGVASKRRQSVDRREEFVTALGGAAKKSYHSA